MKKALVIDGNSLMFRAYYGTLNQLDYYLKNNKTPANAIKLMMLHMFKLIDRNKYDYAVIAFDHKDKNFRKEIYADYKSHRKPTPVHLIEQIEPIHKIMPLFGIRTLCISGIEADDVVGSAVKLFSNHKIKSDVYSSDNDMLQLVSNYCDVIQFKKGLNDVITYTLSNFQELYYGLTPLQVIDFKSISGDSSDNIPGVKGVGPKTTINLLKKYGTVERILENLDSIDSISTKEKFLSAKNELIKFKKLVKILDDKFDNENLDFFKLNNINLKHLKEVIKTFNFSGFDKYL